MRISPPSRACALLALVTLAAACDNATAPESGPDFQSALESYEAMDAALASPGLTGFQALAGRTPFSATPAAVDAVAGVATSSQTDGAHAFARRLAARLAAARSPDGIAAAPIISDTRRGATFIYDPATDRYAIDPGREGAPATGVRFILYEVDAAGNPLVEEEIGYADLVDEGDGSPEDIALHLTGVVGGATVVDYRTTLDATTDGGALTVRGSLEGDGVQVDFDVEVAGHATPSGGQLDVAFEIGVDARDFSITGNVHGVEEDGLGEGDLDVTVRYEDHSIRVELGGGGGQVEGTVFVDGGVFATVSGDASDPTFLGESGEPVTGVEALVLYRIADGFEDVFDLLEDLLDPMDDLVLLGIIL